MSSLSPDVHRDEDTYRQTNFVVVLHELTDSIVSSFYKCNSLPTEFMSLHLLLLKSSVALSQRQSDQIWRNSTTLAKLWKSLVIFWRVTANFLQIENQFWQVFWAIGQIFIEKKLPSGHTAQRPQLCQRFFGFIFSVRHICMISAKIKCQIYRLLARSVDGLVIYCDRNLLFISYKITFVFARNCSLHFDSLLL